jgi:uncharacterized spore protein YtfJ
MVGDPDDANLDQARQAAERERVVDRLFELMTERFGGRTSARTVYGDPVTEGGTTVIPVARIRWAAGAGAGSGGASATEGGPEGQGAGAGGAVVGDPVGYIEVGATGARFVPVRGVPNPLAVLAFGVAISMVLRAVARLVGR